MQNTVHRVEVGGISSGGESRIKWCSNLVGTGVNNTLESFNWCWFLPDWSGVANIKWVNFGLLTYRNSARNGAKQIADIQDLISDKGIKCIFSEPQYNPKIIETLGNDMNISTGVMDPLGAFIDAGPTMYVELINGIANSIKECH